MLSCAIFTQPCSGPMHLDARIEARQMTSARRKWTICDEAAFAAAFAAAEAAAAVAAAAASSCSRAASARPPSWAASTATSPSAAPCRPAEPPPLAATPPALSGSHQPCCWPKRYQGAMMGETPIHKSATLGKNSASGELIQVGTVGCAAAMIAARERGVIRAWSMAELTGMANSRTNSSMVTACHWPWLRPRWRAFTTASVRRCQTFSRGGCACAWESLTPSSTPDALR
mmetsp:Transcript_22413/g.51837  ORF Transcript_22413/g.51837 Transcript_22413/m.51837 type:complete len:230 (-) Transcript_22413:2624-3313(-)